MLSASGTLQIVLIVMASVYNCGRITKELGIATAIIHAGEPR